MTGSFQYVVVPLLPPADVIKELVQKFPTLRFIFGNIESVADEEMDWIGLKSAEM